MGAQIKITDAKKRWSLDQRRINKYDMWIEYSINDETGYFVVIPEEDATPEKVKEEIGKAEVQRRELVSLEFVVE